MVNNRFPARNATSRSTGFSLVELLVVIGIIALLISMLLPALTKARQASYTVACAAQLRSLGQSLFMYGDTYKGWIFPVGQWDGTQYGSLGSNTEPHRRWPISVFPDFKHPPLDPTPTYPPGPLDTLPEAVIQPWTPKWLTCPADIEPRASHSYIINKLLVRNQEKLLKFGRRADKKSVSDIIVAGEKTTIAADYYMEATLLDTGTLDAEGRTEFDRVVEQSRHGIKTGSNYLFFDGHVEKISPKSAADAFSPWSIDTVVPTP